MRKPYDPIKFAAEVGKVVNRGLSRKLCKTRIWGHGYGGVATADLLGCNLFCAYCWVPDEKKVGLPCCNVDKYPFRSPDETYDIVKGLALTRKVSKVRLSGSEPLINMKHVLRFVRIAMSEGRFKVVIDTNALLLTEDFLAAIKPFRDKIYLYVGLKGSSPSVFQELTTAHGKFWYKQLEGLRLIIKHGFTLGINLIANLTPPNTLPFLLDSLFHISPILPMCVDMKKCTYFIHNAKRINRYGIPKFSPMTLKKLWDTMLEQKYGDANSLFEIFKRGETVKAFDRYELRILQQNVEWSNGLKFVQLPEIPFSIPFSKEQVKNGVVQNG